MARDVNTLSFDRFLQVRPYDCIQVLLWSGHTVLPGQEIRGHDEEITWLNFPQMYCQILLNS